MGPEQMGLGPDHLSWLQMLWASPAALLLLFFKGVRELISKKGWGAVKAAVKVLAGDGKEVEETKPVERREEVVTAREFNQLDSKVGILRENMNRGFDHLGQTVESNHAYFLNELKAHDEKVEKRSDALFQKIDNFLAMIAMHQGQK